MVFLTISNNCIRDVSDFCDSLQWRIQDFSDGGANPIGEDVHHHMKLT